MSEVERWITVNGNHIPIMKGESIGKALGNHFRKIRKEHRGKLEKKYNEGQKKIDELRKNLQDAKNSNNAPMTRFYEKKLQDASEEQFKATNRIADSYRTITRRARTKEELLKLRNKFNPGDDSFQIYDKKMNKALSSGKYKLSDKYDVYKKQEKEVKKVKSTTPRVSKPRGVKSGGRINYDDDVVRVVDKKGKVVYQGIDDYNPFRRERMTFVKTTKTDKGYYKYNDGDYYVYKLD